MTAAELTVRLRSEHHEARTVADLLRASTVATADLSAAWFIAFFEDFSWEHCTAEEMTLLPLLAGDAAGRAVADRIRAEHAALRAAAKAVTAGDTDPDRLRAIGALLRDHVDSEERQVYDALAVAPRDPPTMGVPTG
jgi:hypothetical protein